MKVAFLIALAAPSAPPGACPASADPLRDLVNFREYSAGLANSGQPVGALRFLPLERRWDVNSP